MPPETGAAITNRIEAEAVRIRRQAGQLGKAEPFEVHAADALVRLLQGQGAGKGTTEIVIVVDLRALRRGHAHPGELNHIIGGRPVPVSWVKEAMKDAFIKAVVRPHELEVAARGRAPCTLKTE